MINKSDDNFSDSERLRYSRHSVLPGFGYEAQKKLKASRVAVIGAGGLGAPVLSYLAAAGVGHISIVDPDIITESNLQRQVIFTTADLAKDKAMVAATRLADLNPHIHLAPYVTTLKASNAMRILAGNDLIIDCTDNFPTRYLLNDCAVLLDIPLVYGSIFRYEGQVAVFNYKAGPNYRDLYPLPPKPDAVPDCEAGGVLGVLAGVIGSMQANEAIKILSNTGDVLSGRLLTFDSRNNDVQIFEIPNRHQRSTIGGLIDYDDFCGLSQKKEETLGMKEISVQDLKQLIDSKADFQLIDVREPHEFDICNLEGVLIPMGEVPDHTDEISRTKQVIIHCRSGKRSGDIVNWLEKNHGYTNLYNLKGGILAWAKEIDTAMPTY